MFSGPAARTGGWYWRDVDGMTKAALGSTPARPSALRSREATPPVRRCRRARHAPTSPPSPRICADLVWASRTWSRPRRILSAVAAPPEDMSRKWFRRASSVQLWADARETPITRRGGVNVISTHFRPPGSGPDGTSRLVERVAASEIPDVRCCGRACAARLVRRNDAGSREDLAPLLLEDSAQTPVTRSASMTAPRRTTARITARCPRPRYATSPDWRPSTAPVADASLSLGERRQERPRHALAFSPVTVEASSARCGRTAIRAGLPATGTRGTFGATAAARGYRPREHRRRRVRLRAEAAAEAISAR